MRTIEQIRDRFGYDAIFSPEFSREVITDLLNRLGTGGATGTIANFTNNGTDISYNIIETGETVVGFDGTEKTVYNMTVVVPDFPDVSPATTYNIDVSNITLPEAGTPTIISYSYTSRYKDNPATYGESYMTEDASLFMGFSQVSFNYDYNTELAQLYAATKNLTASFAGYYVIFNIKFWVDA